MYHQMVIFHITVPFVSISFYSAPSGLLHFHVGVDNKSYTYSRYVALDFYLIGTIDA